MNQPTFADLDYESKKRKTRREKFLERMDGLIPWEELEERIRPFYPKAGRGRRPYELSVMLRIHFLIAANKSGMWSSPGFAFLHDLMLKGLSSGSAACTWR